MLIMLVFNRQQYDYEGNRKFNRQYKKKVKSAVDTCIIPSN
jgi:hypothetical protein